MSAWLDEHKFYPQSARERAEQGVVAVRFTVTRDGRVLEVSVVHGSGSDILDRATEGLLRNARLPPFPSTMPEPEKTMTIEIRYVLGE